MPPAPSTAPVFMTTSPSRKWLTAPESIVKTIDASATPSAVWIGTPKPTVKSVMTTPAPPAPTKPMSAPKSSIEKKIINLPPHLLSAGAARASSSASRA